MEHADSPRHGGDERGLVLTDCTHHAHTAREEGLANMGRPDLEGRGGGGEGRERERVEVTYRSYDYNTGHLIIIQVI